MARRARAASALAVLAAALAAGCSSSSSGGGDPGDTTPPAPPVPALVTVVQRAPGSADGVSGAAGAVEANAHVFARAGPAQGALIGETDAAADGSFPEIAIGDNLHATVALLAIDAAGNVSTTATVVSNDVAPPETTFDAVTATTGGAHVRYELAASELLASFLCDLDGAGESGCSTPLDLGPLDPGPHTLAVRAVDLAGNPDPTAATTTWTVESWSAAGWRSVSVGYGDAPRASVAACGVTTDDRLYCWGSSPTGALGVGDADPHGDPQLVGTGYRAVSTSGDHTCAIDAGGALWCWGASGHGALGLPPGSDVLAPVRSGSGSDWQAVATGLEFTCGLETSGALSCWGTNQYGQLGDGGGPGARHDPAPVSTAAITGTRWSAVSATGYSACGIRDDASLWCWGANFQGQLGDGSSGNFRSLPVSPGGTWRAVSLQSATACGIRTGGTLWCWGVADYWGDPVGPTPAQVGNEDGWVGLVAAFSSLCAWKADGTTTCWGDNRRGELGTGAAGPGPSTSTPPLLVEAASAGFRTTCAVTKAGELRCWGSNEKGAVGTGVVGDRRVPTQVATGRTFTALAVADGDTCALSGGALFCAGANWSGELGDGTQTGRATLAQSGAATDWTAFALGQGFSLGVRGGALQASGAVPLVGASGYEPVAIGTAGTWDRVASAAHAAFLLRPDGALDAFGYNGQGQLGDGTTATPSAPVPVAGGASWSSVAGFDGSTCGIRADGTLHCWGNNYYGELGNGTCDPSLVPTQVGTDSGWTRVAVGGDRTCAIRDGALSCWGRSYGWSPVPLAAGTSFSEVAAGYYHACAISEGKLFCWGSGSEGQLGLGPVTYTTTPTRVGTASDWTALSLSWKHTCGLRGGGELWCWGSNDFGALGDGSGFYAAPRLVALPPPP